MQLSGCFRLQRYKFLKAIHNRTELLQAAAVVVSDYKDTNFWKQFTTLNELLCLLVGCFRLQRYKFLKAIHNRSAILAWITSVVSNYKDTNFWKQFTTDKRNNRRNITLFQTTKIQIFESNSQREVSKPKKLYSCFKLQRYKFLKAIHNGRFQSQRNDIVVSNYKDTNFWKQFTTAETFGQKEVWLFQTTKIQTFESNSQQRNHILLYILCCFRLQRYKLLKAIHNTMS